ncbi:MAG TPA: heavy-metal-associated domain-containing protein [Pirellulaceae bacterium]|nr:heavy-metal-associated domain-containing protein [Pirellulaceae bacterium]
MHRLAACFAACLLVMAAANVTTAQTRVTYTTIVVQDMHCADCAKQIARKLYALPGVVEVRADVPKNIAYVVPQKDKTVSSRAMWEAVEAAGFKVARLEGPQGTFTAKPR